MTHACDRRSFIAALGAASIAPAALARTQPGGNGADGGGAGKGGPIAISSGNGIRAVERAMELLRLGADPLEAAVSGVNIVEDDPEDMTVGLGGLPNEEGVVELDASVMHGPTHRAGAVASLRNIQNPSRVALEVARRTDHVLIVGEGALRFAKRMGFKETNLLTEKARQAWLDWRASLNDQDDWLDHDELDIPEFPQREQIRTVMHTTGTIHCSALDANGDLGGVTTTSGLSWKLPGRVGDSPIIGAGLYTDNAVGSAGATGRGEACIQSCAAFSVVQRMEAGDAPEEACRHVLRKIVAHTPQRRLLRADGTPDFNVTLYALRKDGAYGSACLLKGGSFAIHDGARSEERPAAHIYD